MEQQKSFPGLDYLKMILALLVVMRHACQYFAPSNSIFYIINVNILSVCAVPCFFTISGYLFFSRENASIKKQCIRLFRLYLIWTLLYLPLNVVLIINKKLTILDLLKNFLFSGSYYHLWFLPALIVALLLNYWLRNKNIVIVAICFSFLFIIALLSEPYNFLVSERIDSLFKFYASIFLTCRNGLFFGSIYVFIGRMLTNIDKYEINAHKIILLFVIGLLFLFAEGILLSLYKHYEVINILSACIILSPMMFLTFIKIHDTKNFSALRCRRFSTVMFCSHPIILGITSKLCKIIQMNSWGGGLVISIFLICIASYLLVIFSEKEKFKIIKLLY